MKLIELPAELALQIVQAADLPPTQLLALGNQLTRSPNVISEAALDDSIWKHWSNVESLRRPSSNSLSEAFVQRLSQKTPAMKQELARLYQHGFGPLNPRLPEDFDLTLAACYAGLGRNVLGFASKRVLLEPCVAVRLLADPTIFSETLPDTLFTLQAACLAFEVPVPSWSISDDVWGKFSPQSALEQRAHVSLFEAAAMRFAAKPAGLKKMIESATETQRLKLFDFIPEQTGHDFDLELAFSQNDGWLTTSPDPVIPRILYAMNHTRQGTISPRAPTQTAMGAEGLFGELWMTAETEREALGLMADFPAFMTRMWAGLRAP